MIITPHQAVKRMRELTELGITFSFSFMSLNNSLGTTTGVKTVNKALLRKSLRRDQSELSNILVAYSDISNSEAHRQFRLPLLLTFNEYTIQP